VNGFEEKPRRGDHELKPSRTQIFRFFFAVAAFAALMGLSLAAPAQAPASPPIATKRTILLLGDTQAPLFWETLILPRNRNEEARQKIMELILSEPDPAAVIHLGDLVALGSEEEGWKPIDDFLARLRARKIPVYGAMGNHEYMFSAVQGTAAFRKRFPEFPQSWYSFRILPLAFIVLNSNIDELTGKEWADQQKFYGDQLAALETDPEVKGIVVCAHHPPYTNNKIISRSVEVDRDFVPLFLKSRKARLFLSGHSHAAEHFVKEGKNFLVLGGGGGLLHPLRIGAESRYEDHFPLRTERRWFHYLRLQANGDGWTATYRMLRQDLGSWVDIYTIAGTWESAATAPATPVKK
jgi:3',5'-cyclic AMP phosphodiesterase CpdA